MMKALRRAFTEGDIGFEIRDREKDVIHE